jgi:enamine deaminase RidA (YjgF/YER057c/UK114 family)
MQLLHPKHWKRPSGYSNGVAADGRQVFVAGQIGWNARSEIVSDDFVAQAEQALKNIVEILAEAGARPEHLVRLTWYVTDRREYLARSSDLGRAYRRTIGRHFPAMTLVQVAALVEDRARVEIDATAVVPAGRAHKRDRIAQRSGKTGRPTVSRR